MCANFGKFCGGGSDRLLQIDNDSSRLIYLFWTEMS